MHLVQSAGYGVSIYVESLLTGLPRERYNQWLLGSEYYKTDTIKQIADGVDCIPMNRNISLLDLKAIVQCWIIIRKRKPDILYCHSAKAGIYGRIACVGTGIKVVYNPHGWSFNMNCSWLKKMFYKTVETLFSIITDKIVAISDYEFKTSPFLIPKWKIKEIPNGIDIEHCLNVLKNSSLKRKDVGIPEKAFVVGIIGRISVQKGQDLFVKVAKQVIKEIPESYFMMVGGKSDDIPIEDIIENLGLSDRIIITGEVNDAVRYATLFDVAVLTSRWEGFGLVLPEYMIAKKPVVAFNVDAVPEIVLDGETGILVSEGDCKGMADAIIDLFTNNKAAAMSQAGYVRAINKFTLARVISEHDRLFTDLKSTGWE